MTNTTSKFLSTEEVLSIAKFIYPNEKIELCGFDVKPKSDKVLGFMGDHFALTLSLKVDGEQVQRQFFMKTYPEKMMMNDDFLGKTGIFQREVDIYTILMTRLLGNAQLLWCPRLYYSKPDVLVLEDLSPDGYTMPEDKSLLTIPQLECLLDALAAFHSSVIALEEELSDEQGKEVRLDQVHPELFTELLYDLKKEDLPSRRWIMKGINDLKASLKWMKGYSEEERTRIGGKLLDAMSRLYPLSEKSKEFRNVVVHGDLWVNNMLFKNKNGKPIAVKIVDYQFTRYAPPAHDIMHLLYFTTTREFRRTHEEWFLRFYYQKLSLRLKEYNRNISVLLPWDNFLESCEVERELALIECLLCLNHIMSPPLEAEGTSSTDEYDVFLARVRDECVRKNFENKEFLSRVPEHFQELIERYIDYK